MGQHPRIRAARIPPKSWRALAHRSSGQASVTLRYWLVLNFKQKHEKTTTSLLPLTPSLREFSITTLALSSILNPSPDTAEKSYWLLNF